MRIPLSLAAGPVGAAYLVEGDLPAPNGAYATRFTLPKTGHITGCACCAPRGAVPAALAAMFRARAMGIAPFFQAVVVLASPAGEAAVRDAVRHDVLAQARYRLQPGS